MLIREGRSSGCGIGCKCRTQSATAVPSACVHVVNREKEQHRNKSKTKELPRQGEPACMQTRYHPWPTASPHGAQGEQHPGAPVPRGCCPGTTPPVPAPHTILTKPPTQSRSPLRLAPLPSPGWVGCWMEIQNPRPHLRPDKPASALSQGPRDWGPWQFGKLLRAAPTLLRINALPPSDRPGASGGLILREQPQTRLTSRASLYPSSIGKTGG